MYWIEINEDNLGEFQNKLGWEGNGTVGNPIIIENLEGLNECLRFKKITSDIIVRNLTLCELYTRSCQNIEIENCNIYYFWVEFCHNIKINNSSIVNLNMEFSKGNVITDNQLHEESFWSKSTLKTYGEEGTKVSIVLNLCGGIFFILLGIIVTISFGYIFSWVIVASLFFLIPVFKFRRRRFIMRKFPPNVFNKNILVDLKELDDKYSAIYDI